MQIASLCLKCLLIYVIAGMSLFLLILLADYVRKNASPPREREETPETEEDLEEYLIFDIMTGRFK